jgi:hypothetical protein
MRLLRRLLGIALLSVFLAAPSAFARGRTRPDGRPKSVHVKGYKTNKGKQVKPYNRRAPKAKK